MQYKELFGIPLFKFRFEKHEELKGEFMKFLEDESLYTRNTSRNTLKFTHPNLHKEKVLSPFTDFVNDSIRDAFILMGFVPSFQITGMWATKHPRNGFHHRHIHGNSYMAGVFYLNGNDETAGTTFHNTHMYNQMIIPAKEKIQPNSAPKSFERVPFEEGSLIVFPSWLSHDTDMNRDDRERVILSFNIMPVGKTNQDPFDRYNYQEIDVEDVISYNDQRYFS